MCMTKHSYFPYTSTYSSMRHNTNKNTTSITPLTQTYNILQHSKAQITHYLLQRLGGGSFKRNASFASRVRVFVELFCSISSHKYSGAVQSIKALKVKINSLYTILSSILNQCHLCNMRPYRRGILQTRSHNCFIGSHECLLLFTPSCCSECVYDL